MLKKNGHSARLGRRVALAAMLAGGTMLATGAYAATNLLETGSSLLYPLFNLWVPVYAKSHPGVQITTQSTGSGTGISQAMSGIAQIGASDAYLADAMVKQHPTLMSIPLAISSQMVNYNVPGQNGDHLKLSGAVLSGIYQGKITKWNDPAIAQLNPGVELPSNTIVPVHRTDGSGDTFIFTQYLDASAPDWKSIGYGTTISWPAVAGGIGAEGNPGMVNAVKNNPYSIAYIGVSFKDAIDSAQLGEAMLENHDGKYVLPDAQTVQAAANAMVGKTPADERISLIFAAGANSYPIINYEYAIVNAQQPDRTEAQAISRFLTWSIATNGGNADSFMTKVSFVPLPASVRALSEKQINKIK
jgi:phosphate transport system substrate-binding protein